MNKDKTKVVVKKHTLLYYADLKNIATGNPLSFFKDIHFEKMTDMVLSNKENLLIYLTSRGKIGFIDLIDRSIKPKNYNIAQLTNEKNEECYSKDSSEIGHSRYFTLRISPDDDYLVVVSTEKWEVGYSFGVIIFKLVHSIKENSFKEVPSLIYSDKKHVMDDRINIPTNDTGSIEFIPQYVNFSIKGKGENHNIVLVFIRGFSKFFVFPVINGKIGQEQALDLFPSSSMIDSGLLVDDGCMIDDTIFIALQSPILLKITYKVN